MNNDELKKKIAQIIAEYCCPLGKTHKQLYGDERQCYSEMNFAECKPITECTDALIAAGIGDVKESENKATAAELVAQAAASTAIKKIAEWKHRAEVYKRALHIAHTAGEFAYYVDKAEKELAEENSGKKKI